MIPSNVSEIDTGHLETLIGNRVAEGKTIEYKRDQIGNSDQEKKEFLADVSSFANTIGGDLIFGIDAPEGIPLALTPLSIFDVDREKQRLDSILQSGLEPRLPHVDIHPVEVSSGNFVVVIRAAQSWIAPHRVSFGNHAKFYARNSSGKYPMDVDELRISFTQTEALAKRIKKFRIDRLAKIASNSTFVGLSNGTGMILHLVPFSSSRTLYDVSSVIHQRGINFMPIGSNGCNDRINIDGHLNYSNTLSQSHAYTQVYRTGIVEAVKIFLSSDDRRGIPSTDYERYIIQRLQAYLKSMEDMGITPPIYLFLTFYNTLGCTFASPYRSYFSETQPIDRDQIILPELVIDDYKVTVDHLVRPLFDMVWNAFGYHRSPNFDAQGNWVERHM